MTCGLELTYILSVHQRLTDTQKTGKATKKLSAPACIDSFWKEQSISYVIDKEVQAITFTFIIICDEKDVIPLLVDWFHTSVKCYLCIPKLLDQDKLLVPISVLLVSVHISLSH